MILKRRKLIGALLLILEDRCGPTFFLRHRVDSIKKKSESVHIPLNKFIFQCLFLHVRTLEIELRTRVISQNACIFTF